MKLRALCWVPESAVKSSHEQARGDGTTKVQERSVGSVQPGGIDVHSSARPGVIDVRGQRATGRDRRTQQRSARRDRRAWTHEAGRTGRQHATEGEKRNRARLSGACRKGQDAGGCCMGRDNLGAVHAKEIGRPQTVHGARLLHAAARGEESSPCEILTR
jgi:hypothetical protein